MRDLLGSAAVGTFAEAARTPPSRSRTRRSRTPDPWKRTPCSPSAADRPSAWARRSPCEPVFRSWRCPAYAGSEMTPILGETEKPQTTRAAAGSAAQDGGLRRRPDAHATAAILVVSGINAMAHAVEALYAQDRDPVAFLMAGEALNSSSRFLRSSRDVRTTARHGRMRCTGRGWRARASARWAWPCTTRCATCWAAHRPSARRNPHRGPAARGHLRRAGGPRSHGTRHAGAAGGRRRERSLRLRREACRALREPRHARWGSSRRPNSSCGRLWNPRPSSPGSCPRLPDPRLGRGDAADAAGQRPSPDRLRHRTLDHHGSTPCVI